MFDYGYEVQDSATFTVSAVGMVDSVAKIVDLGAGKCHGNLVVDVTAIEILSNDEIYDILLQGSSSATFASSITTLARLRLGAKEILQGSADVDSAAGRFRVPFTNEDVKGTKYKYARLYCNVAGNIGASPSIIFSARLEKSQA